MAKKVVIREKPYQGREREATTAELKTLIDTADPDSGATYTPTTTGDWPGTAPALVKTALDSLAEQVTDANLGTVRAYTPASDTHWADANPTTIAAAIDRLAAAVYALGTNTPIA